MYIFPNPVTNINSACRSIVSYMMFAIHILEQPSQELLREVAKAINNTPVTVDALRVELGIPLGDFRSIVGEMELWVKIFRLLEGWRERDAHNNTQALARALYSLNLSRCVEELFKRI